MITPQWQTTANGIVNYQLPVPHTQAVSILIAFPGGAVYETDAEAGIAHVTEHLTFKGSQRYADRAAVRAAAKRCGGRLNAYTSQESVVFHMTGRGTQASAMLDILTEFVANAVYDADDAINERGVVLQEIAARETDAGRARELAVQAAYGDHPLSRPVIGYANTVAKMTAADAVAYRQRTWNTASSICVIGGDTSQLDNSVVNEYLQRIPRVGTRTSIAPVPAFTVSEQLIEAQGNQANIWLVGSASPVTTVADRAARIIANGILTTRLEQTIRGREHLAYSIGSLMDTTNQYATRTWISMGVAAEQYERATALSIEVLNTLIQDGPTDEEVATIREFETTGAILARESASAVARSIADYLVRRPQEIASFDAWDIITQLEQTTIESVRDSLSGIATEMSIAGTIPS